MVVLLGVMFSLFFLVIIVSLNRYSFSPKVTLCSVGQLLSHVCRDNWTCSRLEVLHMTETKTMHIEINKSQVYEAYMLYVIIAHYASIKMWKGTVS